jgi:hypothetical protein
VKKRLAIYGSLSVGLIIAWTAAHYCAVELSAVVWHVRHGFHTQIRNVRVQVPLAYQADDTHGLPWFSISRMPGRFIGPGGFIIFDFRRLPSPEDMEEAEALLRQKDTQTHVQRVRLAERPATLEDAEIDCRFDGDVSAQFIGSSNLRNDFYKIIQTAEPVKRNN